MLTKEDDGFITQNPKVNMKVDNYNANKENYQENEMSHCWYQSKMPFTYLSYLTEKL